MAQVWYINDAGEYVQVMQGALRIGGREIPIVDGFLEEPKTPLFRVVVAAEWDLIARYDRGELTQ